MKVSLIDLDSFDKRKSYPAFYKKRFPNLALMKLSAWHKAKGDEVTLNFPLVQADATYASCVFTWNAHRGSSTVPRGTILGGSGVDLKSMLPSEIEHMKPDYDLYGIDFSMGFTSRGCIRKCSWCIVPEKEGEIKPWAEIYEFWDRRHHKILLLDNNLLASPNWMETLQALGREQTKVDFNQGLDIRLLTDDNISLLKQIKFKQLRFSFDHPSLEPPVKRGIEMLLKAGVASRRLSFYVLVGFNTTLGEDIERIKLLQSYNVEVYPMGYRGSDGKEPKLSGKFSDIPYHGSLRNRTYFLRLAGRLP